MATHLFGPFQQEIQSTYLLIKDCFMGASIPDHVTITGFGQT
ncbi:hypothetical protein [Bacillus cereus]|nr:hypothetical protein [Bacillus cereus]